MHSTYVGQRQRTYSESLYAIPDMTHMRQLIRGGVVAGTGGALRERPRADGQRQRHQHLPVRERLAGAHCVYSGVQAYNLYLTGERVWQDGRRRRSAVRGRTALPLPGVPIRRYTTHAYLRCTGSCYMHCIGLRSRCHAGEESQSGLGWW